MKTPEAFRAVVKVTLDKLRLDGHEVPDHLSGECEVVDAGGSVEVVLVCSRCMGYLAIYCDEDRIFLDGSLLSVATEFLCQKQ